MPTGSKTLTIEEAEKYTGYSSQYIRFLIRSDKLPSTLTAIEEGSNILRHEINKEDLDAFLRAPERKTKRTDHRNKYIFYATPEELDETIRVLNAANRTTQAVAKLIKPANRLKPNRRPHGQ